MTFDMPPGAVYSDLLSDVFHMARFYILPSYVPLKARRRRGIKKKAARERKWLRQHTKDIGKARFAGIVWSELDRLGLPRNLTESVFHETHEIILGGDKLTFQQKENTLLCFDEMHPWQPRLHQPPEEKT